MALISPSDIVTGWDSHLLDGAFCWGGALDHLVATGGHTLVTAEDLCCNPLLGTNGKSIFDTIVVHDLFLQKHGRKVYNAILTHVTRVLALFDAASMGAPEQFAIGTPYLHDIGTAAMTDMSPLDGKGAYNYKDEATVRATIFLYTKLNQQQQLSCAFLADQQTQACVAGGFAKGTIDTATFLVDNKILPRYTKNQSVTQTYIDSTYVRDAPTLLPGTTLASLKTRGPGPETVLPSPTATKCNSRRVMTATTATFGDGHAPGGVYLDGMECGWVLPAPPTGKVLTLSFSLFSCEVEMDSLDVYTHAGGNATSTGVLLGHFTGRMSGHGAVPSVASSATGMFVAWKTDNIMSRAFVNPSEDGFTASYNSASAGCTNDAECGSTSTAGTCDKSTGLCVCSPGYGGSDCTYDSCFGTVHLQSMGTLKSHAPGRTTSRNNARCVWELDTTQMGLVASLRFDRFDLEDTFDTLTVYAYTMDTNVKSLLREFSGSAYAPGLVVRSPGRRLTVEFSSDAIHMSSGFEITFEGKPFNKHCEEDADCSGSGTCTQTVNLCDCNPGFTGHQCECGPGLCGNDPTAGPPQPFIHGVTPRFASPFGGDTMMITGHNFRAGILSITVGGKVCHTPKLLNPTTLSCITPAGEGANIAVQVTINNINSNPAIVFAYKLPIIATISRQWLWHEGSSIIVQGHDFVAGQTYCRLGLSEKVFALVIDRKHLQCKVGDNALNSKSPLLLYVSNDGGQRFVSGLLGVFGEMRWFNNSMVTPVTAFSIYTEVHVGALIAKSSSSIDVASIVDGLEKGAALAERDHIFGTAIKVSVHFIESNNDGTTAARNTEALLRSFPDVVGIVGGWHSSDTIRVAANISLPRRLPMISYGASHSSLGGKNALPYFLRTCASMTNEVAELVNLFNVFRWNRIGIITSTDPYSLDAGQSMHHRLTAVRDSDGGSGDHAKVNKKNPVLYTGHFTKLADGAGAAEIDAAASNRGANGLATHARRLKESGARVIFFLVNTASSARALFQAFATAGFNSSGYAFVSTWLPADLPVEAEGTIALEREYPPPTPFASSSQKLSNHGRDAHDAMYALLRGVGAVITGGDGGVKYKANTGDARRDAMAHMRLTTLPESKMASGALSFDPNSNDRAATDLVFNIVTAKRVKGRKILVLVPVGRLSNDKQTFVADTGVSFVWPGNSSALPADRDLTGIAPKTVTIAWLEKPSSYYDYPLMEKYLQWSLARLNANKYLLAHTRLELRHEIVSASGAAFTAACERVRREAEAEGKPVVGFISSG